jgi:GT2 family glycosyltransferase
MPDQPTHRRARRRWVRRNDQRELIHLLNQRYHQAWERAEQLQDELARIRSWWIWPVLAWLRRVKQWLRPAASASNHEPPSSSCRTLTEIPGTPTGLVSIVIPFKDSLPLLRNCLTSLRASTYRRFEIVLVNNGSTEPRTLRFLWRVASRPGVQVVDCPGPFNFSRLCNEGARRARGEHVLFLNNDTELLTRNWLERMLFLERQPEVGVVGATLLYPDHTIQHAGLAPRGDGNWVHLHRGRPVRSAGEEGELRQVRTVPAVTGACLLMRREQFLELGGFDERLPVTFSDVDLCCRVRQRGLLVVVTPHARLFHFECLSRGYAVDSPGAAHLAALARFPEENVATSF